MRIEACVFISSISNEFYCGYISLWLMMKSHLISLAIKRHWTVTVWWEWEKEIIKNASSEYFFFRQKIPFLLLAYEKSSRTNDLTEPKREREKSVKKFNLILKWKRIIRVRERKIFIIFLIKSSSCHASYVISCR